MKKKEKGTYSRIKRGFGALLKKGGKAIDKYTEGREKVKKGLNLVSEKAEKFVGKEYSWDMRDLKDPMDIDI